MKIRIRLAIMATGLITILAAGCGDSRDARLAEMAQRSLDEQARQNERLAEQSKQIAEATSRLVQADAQSRQRIGRIPGRAAEGNRNRSR
jgi:hypothetical protein